MRGTARSDARQRARVGHRPVAHAKLHQLEGIAREHDPRAAMRARNRSTRSARSRRRELHVSDGDRRRQQSLIAADLIDIDCPCGQRQIGRSGRWRRSGRASGTCAAPRRDTETILPLTSCSSPKTSGTQGARDRRRPDNSAGRRRRRSRSNSTSGISYLPAGSCSASPRVPITCKPEQAGVDIQAVDAHGVIVIPEQRRLLLVGIVVGARLARARTSPPDSRRSRAGLCAPCRCTTLRTSGTPASAPCSV